MLCVFSFLVQLVQKTEEAYFTSTYFFPNSEFKSTNQLVEVALGIKVLSLLPALTFSLMFKFTIVVFS